MINTDEILFRCSSLGHLMTEPKSKSETLSETTKNHLVDVWIRHKYNRKELITSKYMEKGTMVEEDAMTLYSRFRKQYYVKNEKMLTDDFIKGIPDIITEKTVIDLKSSWDIFTFFRTKQKAVEKMYYWQLQGYMSLTGKENARLVYCLVNTPQVLIDDEIHRLQYKHLSEADAIKARNQIEMNSIFDDIDIQDKIYEIEIKRNNEDIERLYNRIIDCRNWIKENLKF